MASTLKLSGMHLFTIILQEQSQLRLITINSFAPEIYKHSFTSWWKLEKYHRNLFTSKRNQENFDFLSTEYVSRHKVHLQKCFLLKGSYFTSDSLFQCAVY